MSKALAVAAGAPLDRDRTDPSIADVLRFDPTLPFSQEVRELASRDLCRWSHRALLPSARVLSLVAVACIRFCKRAAPFQFSWHRAIDVLCVWFLRRFVSADAGELLARHFTVETNLLAFIAHNCGAMIPAPDLRPRRLEDLGGGAVMQHDLAVYNLIVDVGLAGADVRTARSPLDFSSLEVPPIDAERSRKRILELDIETSLYLMNIPFCLFTTEREYERAVNSFQLDESIGAMLAGLSGDPIFRTWTPNKFPAWISVRRDVARELFWHACVSEYAHTHLEYIRDQRGRGQRAQLV